MKITMLGFTGVGKTTYMAAMYHRLGREGISGFKLKAERNLDIRLGELWERIGIHGVWPDTTGTSQLEIMKFKLFHKDQFVTDFEFVDYRGGALKDALDKKDAAQLYGHVFESNAILLLADAWYIANQDADIAEARNQINNIQNLIEDFLDEHPAKPLTIAILLTKFDALTPAQFRQFETRTMALFSRTIIRIRNERHRLRGSFIPVTVAGFGNTKLYVDDHQGRFGMPTVEMRLVSRPRPQYVHWPILYAVAKELEMQKLAARQRSDILKGKLDTVVTRPIWIDYLLSKAEGIPTQKAQREKLANDLMREQRIFYQKMDALEPFVSEVAILPEIANHDTIYTPRW